jgi:hypothetical protein
VLASAVGTSYARLNMPISEDGLVVTGVFGAIYS